MAASSNDTVSDGLKKLFTQVAQIKLLPDGQQHMQFLTMLEQAVMKYLQTIASGAAAMGSPGGGAGGPGGPPPGGPPGPPSPGGAPPAAQFAPGGGSGGGNVGLAPNINPDELNRVLAGVGGPQ